MRSLLTGFATVFNRRHRRVGHLFQNRYRSIVCEAERYFLELVRYIHLNPVRGGIVGHVDELDEYAYTGHSALLSTVPRSWQSVEGVLELFGRTRGWARAAYRKYVADGALLGERPEFAGGGLVRSAGGWQAVKHLRRGREEFKSDERVLGGSEFVDGLLHEVGTAVAGHPQAPPLSWLKNLVCDAAGVPVYAIHGSGRRARVVANVREGLAFLWVEYFGRGGRELALDLGLRPESIYKAAKRGRVQRDRWSRIVGAQPTRCDGQ
jgi:hypothetical protein